MTDLSFDALRPGIEADWAKTIGKGGIVPSRLAEVYREARAILAPAAKLRLVEVESSTRVPWFVTGIVITREAGSPPNFHAWLHNGDPMFDHEGRPRQTTHDPAACPANPNMTWEEGCFDAYRREGLIGKTDWSPAFVAYMLEKFNGFGYRLYHNMPTPYCWGSTVVQTPGKYTRDKHFDLHVMDTQIGGMAILAALMELAPAEIKFPTNEVNI